MKQIMAYHLCLVIGRMPVHVLSQGIAQGIYAFLAGLKMLIDPNPSLPVRLHAASLRVEQIGVGLAACCQKNLIALKLKNSPILHVFGRDSFPPSSAFHGDDLMAGDNSHEQGQSLLNQPSRLRVLSFQEKRMAADYGDINTQSGKEVAELAGDIASPDDDQAAGQLFCLEKRHIVQKSRLPQAGNGR